MSKDIDPLSAMLGSSSSTTTADVWKKAEAAIGGGASEALSSVDMSKVKLKETKKTDISASAPIVEKVGVDTSTGDRIDRFGLGVDLFGGLSKPATKRGDIFDEIKTEIDSSDNVFLKARGAAAEASNDEFSSDMNAKVDPINSNQKMRVAYEEEDDKLNDLKVTSLLEEEELDFEMFGKAKGKLRKGHDERDKLRKGTAGISAVKAEDFDSGKLTDEYLASMSQAASGKDLSERHVASAVTDTGYKPPTTPSKASADAAAALDLNSLDLESYISQQSEASKGGLFD